MGRFLIRLFLKIFFLTFLCFFLASSSWAQQDGFSQSQNDKSLTPEQKISSEGKESLTPEQEIALEEEQSLTHEQKVATEEEEPATREHKIPSEKRKLFTRGQKTLLLNAGTMAAVLI